MSKFKVGDWVYASDWCYGQIVDIEESGECADVEFSTDGGGGCFAFPISDLTNAEPPKIWSSDPEKNDDLRWIIEAFKRLVSHAKICGFDIRLSPDSKNDLELYYHEDYPNLILVDKGVE